MNNQDYVRINKPVANIFGAIVSDALDAETEKVMSRAEHLKWCKDRAMEYVNSGDFKGAVTSMLSDLSKHKDTKRSSTGICAELGMMELLTGPTEKKITRFIQGFN